MVFYFLSSLQPHPEIASGSAGGGDRPGEEAVDARGAQASGQANKGRREGGGQRGGSTSGGSGGGGGAGGGRRGGGGAGGGASEAGPRGAREEELEHEDGVRYVMYMGRDKYENEDLIRYGWPEDLWFHVENLSSAHVYLRLQTGQKLEDVPEEVIMECAHLVKANSIEGCKRAEVDVIYTRWRNLRKTDNMQPGEVSFHDRSKVQTLRRVTKNKAVVNALMRTREERSPDLAAEQEEHAAEFRRAKKRQVREQRRREEEEKKRRAEEAEKRSYSNLLTEDNMVSNASFAATADDTAAKEYEESFF